MNQCNNLLFATINSLPSMDVDQAIREISELPYKYSWWDTYRNIAMIPIMTKQGQGHKEGTSNNREGDFAWTDYAPPTIVNWFENGVLDWLGSKSRIMILITQPGSANNEHIDCDKHELNTRQHKFRYVLQGKTDTLYWLTDKGRVYAPDTNKPFIMDGGWPHGMTNTTNDIKITLALGSPWAGKSDYKDDLTILQDRTDFVMAEDIDQLWNK